MRLLGTLALAVVVLIVSGCSATSDDGANLERSEREQRSAQERAVTTPPPDRTLPAAHRGGIWISHAELMRLPTSGEAWDQLKAAADGPMEARDIADQDSKHDVKTLAVALVSARTSDPDYRERAAEAIAGAVGTEKGGRTLALGRNLLSYVIAADVIDFRAYDPAREAEFRAWLRKVRHEPLGSETVSDQTLIGTHERSPSNWGGMAGASRAAIAAYLRDEAELDRVAKVMKGWLGDRTAYPGTPGPLFGPDDVGRSFRFGGSEDDLSWHADPLRPRGVNPKRARKEGHSIDGALPDDMRRGGEFTWPPKYTQYPREALSGYVALAEILYRQGYDVYRWEDRALLRACRFLFELEEKFPEQEWWEPGVPAYWIVNYRYGTSFPVAGDGLGRNFGWTDWTHAPG
ncbi:MAG: alginate lyase family protein [Gaiellaceae bacterium]